MILLDSNGVLVHDEVIEPGEAIRKSLANRGSICSYATDSVLYRFDTQGNLLLVYLSRPQFRHITIAPWVSASFRKDGRVATDTVVIRDVGCGQARVYLWDCSFAVPLGVFPQ